jgi:hypothetical protein
MPDYRAFQANYFQNDYFQVGIPANFVSPNMNFVFQFDNAGEEVHDEVVGLLLPSSYGILWVFDIRPTSLGLQVPGFWWTLLQPTSQVGVLWSHPNLQFIYSVPDGAFANNIDPGLMANLEIISVYGQIYWGPYRNVGVGA